MGLSIEGDFFDVIRDGVVSFFFLSSFKFYFVVLFCFFSCSNLQHTCQLTQLKKNKKFLCNLVNKIDPHANIQPNIKARAGNFFAKENINKFLQFCNRLGVAPTQRFELNDLHEMKNPTYVLFNILS